MSGQNRRNRRKRPARNTTDDSLADLIPSYAPKQRETFLKGFRILAKVAVRAHLHRQSAAAPRPDDGREEEDTLKPSPSSTWAGAPVLGNGESGDIRPRAGLRHFRQHPLGVSFNSRGWRASLEERA